MEEHSVEQSFANIEAILEQLESNEISLDDSFNLYKKGMEELQYCTAKIEETKKAVLAINAAGQTSVFEEVES